MTIEQLRALNERLREYIDWLNEFRPGCLDAAIADACSMSVLVEIAALREARAQ